MKYWRGYLVAIIFAAITGALVAFAAANAKLVDMVYPYISKTLVSSLANWSSGTAFCLWNMIILALIAAFLVSVILMILLRWNPIQWLGWVLAVVTFLSLFSTGLYGLNKYAGPLSDDIRLEVVDPNKADLKEAAAYFQDQALALSKKINRDSDGDPDFASFETLAIQAGDGFKVLTYQEALSVFSGSTAPVKKMALLGKMSDTFALTGESVVDPSVADLLLPFVMSAEMARRMTIYRQEDANFAAFLACMHNPSKEFQYSAYCMAYALSLEMMENSGKSELRAAAKTLRANAGSKLTSDAELCLDAFSEDPSGKLMVSWYIQNFITPLHEEEEVRFDPTDSEQVDLTYQEPDPEPLPAN